MVLHRDTHDVKLLVIALFLVAVNDLIIELLVSDIFPEYLCLVKIIYKVSLIIAQMRINLVPAPACRILRMHRNRRIADILQV